MTKLESARRRGIRQALTLDVLKGLFSYNPDTGIFTRIGATQENAERWIGKPVGCLNSGGYRVIKIHCVQFKAHQLAWWFISGRFPADEIDHINGIKDDNRACNLRAASKTENLRNTSLYRSNKSGYKGVSFHTGNGRWSANIRIDKIQTYLGYYDTAEEAHDAYCEAARKHFDEFWRKE